MALATLIGVAWLIQRWDLLLASWINIQLLGMIAATGVAFGAMVKDVRARWPAAVVLVCAAPMSQALLKPLLDLPGIIRYVGLPGLLMILGSIATMGVACFILIAKVPPIPADPIPRARRR